VKRYAPMLVAGVLVLSTVTAGTSTAHNAPNRCGHKRAPGAGWYRLRGHNTGCRKARRVARRWERRCITERCPRRRPVEIRVKQTFHCRYRSIPDSDFGVRVRCWATGGRVVHFLWGA
jgi:hypothetical protein